MTTPPLQSQLNVLKLLDDHLESEISLKEREADKLASQLHEIENDLTKLRSIQRMQKINAEQQIYISQES